MRLELKRWLCLAASVAAVSSATLAGAFAFSESDTSTPVYGEDVSSASSGEAEPPESEPSPETSSEDASSSDASSSEEASSEADSSGAQTPSSSGEASEPQEPLSPADEARTSSGQGATDGPLLDSQMREIYEARGGFDKNPVRARVASLIPADALADGLFSGRTPESVVFEAVIGEGMLEGAAVTALRPLDEAAAAHARPLRPGDSVYLTLSRDDTETVRGTFSDYSRFPAVLWALAAVAALVLVCVPRKAGLKLLAVLAFSGALVAFVVVPHPSLLWAALSCCAAAAFATLVFYGLKYRTLAAFLGCGASLAAAGGLAAGGCALFRLSGIPDAELLRAQYTAGQALDLRAVLVAGVLLAALGALVMVCNAAASGAEPRGEALAPSTAFARGVRRGVSAMLPAVTALGFVLFGALLASAAVLYAGGMPAGRILSDERVALLLTAAIACLGSLAVSVPLTAGICALLLRWRRREDGSLREFRVAEWISARERALFGRASDRLDDAIRAAAGGTEEAEQAIERAENEMDRELEAEEAALEAEEEKDRAEQEAYRQTAQKNRPPRKKRPPKAAGQDRPE